MTVSPFLVVEIKSAARKGLSERTIAARLSVHRSTVNRVLNGWTPRTRPSRCELIADVQLLLDRGYDVGQVAAQLGVSRRTIHRWIAA